MLYVGDLSIDNYGWVGRTNQLYGQQLRQQLSLSLSLNMIYRRIAREKSKVESVAHKQTRAFWKAQKININKSCDISPG